MMLAAVASVVGTARRSTGASLAGLAAVALSAWRMSARMARGVVWAVLAVAAAMGITSGITLSWAVCVTLLAVAAGLLISEWPGELWGQFEEQAAPWASPSKQGKSRAPPKGIMKHTQEYAAGPPRSMRSPTAMAPPRSVPAAAAYSPPVAPVPGVVSAASSWQMVGSTPQAPSPWAPVGTPPAPSPGASQPGLMGPMGSAATLYGGHPADASPLGAAGLASPPARVFYGQMPPPQAPLYATNHGDGRGYHPGGPPGADGPGGGGPPGPSSGNSHRVWPPPRMPQPGVPPGPQGYLPHGGGPPPFGPPGGDPILAKRWWDACARGGSALRWRAAAV